MGVRRGGRKLSPNTGRATTAGAKTGSISAGKSASSAAAPSNHQEVGIPGAGFRIGVAHKDSAHSAPSLHSESTRTALERVLLLNATHEPLAVVTSRRALILILAGKATSIQDRQSGAIRSERLVLQMPAVVRLNRYIRVPYRAPTSVTRAGILRRDNKSCAYCGAKGDTIDHVVPRSRGGVHSWENCVACCSKCNTRKADRTLDELGWQLLFTPAPPRRTSGGHVWMADDADPAWAPWLADGTAA